MATMGGIRAQKVLNMRLGESSDTGLFAVANAPAMTTARMTTAATRVRMDLRFICFSLLKKFES